MKINSKTQRLSFVDKQKSKNTNLLKSIAFCIGSGLLSGLWATESENSFDENRLLSDLLATESEDSSDENRLLSDLLAIGSNSSEASSFYDSVLSDFWAIGSNSFEASSSDESSFDDSMLRDLWAIGSNSSDENSSDESSFDDRSPSWGFLAIGSNSFDDISSDDSSSDDISFDEISSDDISFDDISLLSDFWAIGSNSSDEISSDDRSSRANSSGSNSSGSNSSGASSSGSNSSGSNSSGASSSGSNSSGSNSSGSNSSRSNSSGSNSSGSNSSGSNSSDESSSDDRSSDDRSSDDRSSGSNSSGSNSSDENSSDDSSSGTSTLETSSQGQMMPCYRCNYETFKNMIPKEIATINPKFMKFIAKMGNFNDVNEPQELLQVLISPIMQRLAYVTIVDKDIHECIERNSIDELEEVLQNLESIIKSKENFFSQNDILSWLQSAIQNNDMLSLALFIVHKIYIPDCEVSKPCDDPIISYAFNQEKTDIHCFLEKIFWQLKPNEGSSKLPESGSDLVQKFSYFPLIEGRKDTINALKRNIRFARELCSDFGQPNHLSYII